MKLPLTLATVIALGLSATAHSQDRGEVSSKSVLSPLQEVPVDGAPDPTDSEAGSNALGLGLVTFNRKLTRVQINVAFSNLSGAFTRLHMHCDTTGGFGNGPVVLGLVDLVPSGDMPSPVDHSERVALSSNAVEGSAFKRHINGNNPCGVTDIESLAAAIDRGEIYFNLHTTAFPAGELRGNVVSVNAELEDSDSQEDSGDQGNSGGGGYGGYGG